MWSPWWQPPTVMLHFSMQMLVKFTPGSDGQSKARAFKRAGLAMGDTNIVSAAPDGEWVLARVPPGLLGLQNRRAGASVARGQSSSRSALSGLARLIAADPSVQHVEPNFIYMTQLEPNELGSTGSGLWGMRDGPGGANATGAWDTKTDCSNIAVGVIDEVRGRSGQRRVAWPSPDWTPAIRGRPCVQVAPKRWTLSACERPASCSDAHRAARRESW